MIKTEQLLIITIEDVALYQNGCNSPCCRLLTKFDVKHFKTLMFFNFYMYNKKREKTTIRKPRKKYVKSPSKN